jgi:hypothetical protein
MSQDIGSSPAGKTAQDFPGKRNGMGKLEVSFNMQHLCNGHVHRNSSQLARDL